METITTERLTIRRFTPADLADYLTLRSHPEVARYMTADPMDEEQTARFLAKQAEAQPDETGRYHAYAVCRHGEERVIGEVGFYLDDRTPGKGDLGYALHPDFQGAGHATEAARALVRYGFETRDLRRITAACDARNAASYRLMERLGMRREGHLLQSHLARGVWCDELLYALLHDEWLLQMGVGR